jgi:hypothetical protein
MSLAIETSRFQTQQTEIPIPYTVHIIKMIDLIKYCESMVGGKGANKQSKTTIELSCI